jgi:hypothetical protein
MSIAEPATLITDYLLAAFTGYLSWRLFRAAHQNGLIAQWWWAVAFAATAVAGVAGGSVHGFRPMLHPSVTAGLWLVTLESLVVAAFAVIRGTLAGSPLGPETVRAASLVAAGAYVAYGVWIANHPRFVLAIGAYGVALSVLVAFKLSAWRSEDRAARWMMAGVIVSVLAAVVQQSGWSLHRHFNHNDLYHVVQAIGVWLLYRGAILGGRPSAVGGGQLASGFRP